MPPCRVYTCLQTCLCHIVRRWENKQLQIIHEHHAQMSVWGIGVPQLCTVQRHHAKVEYDRSFGVEFLQLCTPGTHKGGHLHAERSKVTDSLTWGPFEKVKPATNTAPVGPARSTKLLSCCDGSSTHCIECANAILLHMQMSGRCRMRQHVLGKTHRLGLWVR